MPSARKSPAMTHPIVITLLIFAIIGFMYFAGEVLKPLALAILLAFAFAPLCSMLERRGVPRFVAAVFTVLLAVGAIGGIGYKLAQQLDSLASQLPKYESNILKKLEKFRGGGEGTIENINKLVDHASETIAPKPAEAPARITDVRIVNPEADFFASFGEKVGPYLEAVGIFAFVLILVLFILSSREDLVDRIVRLFGTTKVSLTTKSMGEVGHRISRYLLMFAAVNSGVGLVVGLGLWAIGLDYPLVWGVLAAMLRFVPYAGPSAAFALPFIFSLGQFPDWQGPLMVAGLFLSLEVVANSFLEPMIYGKTTGVSSLGLLVAAMFWTWLWGALGLLLSTPLTVCLAVLGKYVPALKVFATFLGEEATLKPDVRFYQRLLAKDQDGAASLADEVLKESPRAALFDGVFVPTLAMVERDFARDGIDEEQRDFAWWVVDEIVQDIGSNAPGEVDLPVSALTASGTGVGSKLPEPARADAVRVVGVPTNDRGDLLALRMLHVLLEPSGCDFKIVELAETPLKMVEGLAADEPGLILVSHVPPSGLTTTRYLVRRLRARFPKVPILVGRWADTGDTDAAADQLGAAGATRVVFSLAEARDHILGRQPAASPSPVVSKEGAAAGA